MTSVRAVVVLLVGCGRVNFGYPIVPCDEVTSLSSRLGDNEHCYTRHDGPVQVTGARNACHALGGHLASVTSQEENDDIVSLGLTGATRIGLSTAGAMSFAWESKEALVYTAWGPGEPIYAVNADTNAAIHPDGSWRGLPDLNVAPFACEIEPWHVVDGHGYRLSYTVATWLDAKRACEEMGAHLVTITSAAERDAVAWLGAPFSWIGLTITAGVPSWITGESVDFLAWEATQPDETFDSCVQVTDVEDWVDRSCIETVPAICERDE